MVASLLSASAYAVPVSVSSHDLSLIPAYLTANTQIVYTGPTTVQMEMQESQLLELAQHFHRMKGRCGGFVVGDAYQSKSRSVIHGRENIPEVLNRQAEVLALLPQVQEAKIAETIRWFSSYPTRNYQTPSGIQAMKDLALRWQELVAHLPHAEVKLWKHSEWEQPSVVLQIKGESNGEIILGGHGDSINTDSSDPLAPSPGADDNASGIAVLTEIIRVLGENKYRPKHTLTFIAYAAEEVGLRGSMDISASYAAQGTNVKGVIQFDGTNFKGSQELGMTLIEDLVDPALNRLLTQLIDEYLKLPWAFDRCGYACSDHYSWTYRGYPATFPYESRVREENPHIHTARDLIGVSQDNAHHAVPFARLGLAYALELDQ